MDRKSVFLVCVASLLLSAWASGGHLGVSSQCRNGDCLVTASSSIGSVVLAFALMAFLICYRQRVQALDLSAIVGLWRRLGSFFLDFVLVLLIVSPLGALPILLAESTYSGAFQWSFERNYARPTDSSYVFPGVFVAFCTLFFYFYAHARAGRQTLGQYVSGYRISGSSGTGKPRHALRVAMAFLGLCIWPISLIGAVRHPRKALWWDSVTNTTAVRVTAAQ